jgi:hypothetical protein
MLSMEHRSSVREYGHDNCAAHTSCAIIHELPWFAGKPHSCTEQKLPRGLSDAKF